MSNTPQSFEEAQIAILKLIIENARLKGQYIGSLKALLWWDLPKELKSKIEGQIKKLESE